MVHCVRLPPPSSSGEPASFPCAADSGTNAPTVAQKNSNIARPAGVLFIILSHPHRLTDIIFRAAGIRAYRTSGIILTYDPFRLGRTAHGQCGSPPSDPSNRAFPFPAAPEVQRAGVPLGQSPNLHCTPASRPIQARTASSAVNRTSRPAPG